MSGRRSKLIEPIPIEQPSSVKAVGFLLLGIAAQLAFFFLAKPQELEQPRALIVMYVLSALALDLFVGASRRVSLQRISPVLILALLVTPGIPGSVALIADLIATLAIVVTSKITMQLIAQAGKSLLPAALTALFLASRSSVDLSTYFLAAEIFLVVSLFTRTSHAPFRTDVFLVVSFPAAALMLRSLSDLHLGYYLLSLPLLVLMTTIDTAMLVRYFRLQKRLDNTENEARASHQAKIESEKESQRRAILLGRRERQLELLNGLGNQLDAAEEMSDLARFLLQESHRLIEAERGVVVFVENTRISNILSPISLDKIGLRIGDPAPGLIREGLSAKPPWKAPVWNNQQIFLNVALGTQGWLILSHSAEEAFPEFLQEFFAAVGRHAGSALLALHRLTDVTETAKREAREKERVAEEKEKVAEQNRNLRSLIESFDSLTSGALSTDRKLLEQGVDIFKDLSGADFVALGYPKDDFQADGKGGGSYRGRHWPSALALEGNGPTGNLLCLGAEPDRFSKGQVEWCALLRDFLDKTVENGTLHRKISSSLAKLHETQEEVVRSSQWAAAGRLAANAAHELNTPLGAIRLAAEQVQYFSKDAPKPAQASLNSILRSVDRCREVTDRLLITSRPVDRGENATEAEKTQLIPIIRDAIAAVQPYLRATGIKLASHRVTGDPYVQAVLQDVYWALVNILKNGIDALNDHDGTDKRIAVALEIEDSNAVVRISDNGPGVPEELADKIFVPFFTTKKIGQGNGLGLALSKSNLQSHGGDIQLASNSDGGATFVVTLPLA